jgi:hypothetical protein
LYSEQRIRQEKVSKEDCFPFQSGNDKHTFIPHLPDVPAAEEIKKEGLDLGNNQAVLLKKIEELTLYIIQQQKQLEAQQKRIDTIEKKMRNK